MPTSTNNGFLVVADITGYTTYLNHSELEHAQDVLKTLLDLLIGHTRPPLVLSGLEGDAVLSYTIDSDRFEGQAFVEMIETTYVAFKRAIDLMVMNTTCKCNACANINNLDLKFFVHHGEFFVQELGGGEELVGSDVNLIHRVLKNGIVETTGCRAYTFYTQPAVDRLQLFGFEDDLLEYSEEFADVGLVIGRVMDMKPIWEIRKDQSDLDIDDDRTANFVEEYPLPPELIWGYLTNPETRAVYSGAVRQAAHGRRNGRVSAGTVYECFHGDGSVSTNTVLEWRPFTRMVTQNTLTKKTSFIATFELEPTDDGTRVVMKYRRPQGPRIESVVLSVLWALIYKRREGRGMGKLRELIEEDIAEGRVVVPMEAAMVSDEIRDAAASEALANLASG